MASNTSYVGDYYCVFKKTKNIKKSKHNQFFLTKKVKDVLFSRNGKAPKNLIQRIIILSILNENMDLQLLEKFEEIIKPIATEDREYYYLRPELHDENILHEHSIDKVITHIAETELSDGKKTIQNFYEKVLEGTDNIGSPLLSEVKSILNGKVLFDKNFCFLQVLNETKTLFRK